MRQTISILYNEIIMKCPKGKNTAGPEIQCVRSATSNVKITP